ncbi:hypothetical protein N7504_004367 [Penicillium tannophilum]|nr:hypothetical protein N7504_004367 [Penicillium tannophilum]
MKLLPAFFAFSLFSQVLAIPTSNSVADEVSTSSELVPMVSVSHQNELERRTSCTNVAKGIYATTTMQVAVIFVAAVSYPVKKLCKWNGYETCEEWASEVNEVFTWLLALTEAKKHYGEVSTYISSYSVHWTSARRSLPHDFHSEHLWALEYALNSTGYQYDSLVNLTLPSGGVKQNKDDPALVSHVLMMNVRKGNGTGRDYTMLQFEDGVGQLQIPFEGSSASATSHQKRTSGKGVKISFDIGSARISMEKHVVGAAKAIATKWHTYAVEGYSNMYGFVEKVDKAALYFRTIVEMEGFGTNYESVNNCGALYEYLGEYLGTD